MEAGLGVRSLDLNGWVIATPLAAAITVALYVRHDDHSPLGVLSTSLRPLTGSRSAKPQQRTPSTEPPSDRCC
jgi:hypothetical protein